MNYNFQSYCRRSSGLWNSTRFIVEGLQVRGVDAEIVEVNDNNDIDREVRNFAPDIVVIEALWVVPEKFPILQKLHPKVKWFVHMHSGLPFLALEGIAMDWLSRYPGVGVDIIANSPETFQAFTAIVPEEHVVYLPNVYIPDFRRSVKLDRESDTIDIGCFGAIRPMKNQLTQAIAAMEFANEKGLILNFHINGSRVEVGGSPVLKNLIQLFENHPKHKLILHDWMEPDVFLDFLHENIDLGMQVSLTETFNVVTADYVTAGLPVVVSKEVPWASTLSVCDDDNIRDIVNVMKRALLLRFIIKWNQLLLSSASNDAQDMWYEWVRRIIKPFLM